MIDMTWITTAGSSALMVVLTALGIYAALILLTRISGLRTFSKMSSFDFAITVATGSVLATTLLSSEPPLLQGVVALIAMYALQFSVAFLRSRFRAFGRVVDNQPLLLMDGATVLHDNLKHARMTMEDLRARLREANVIHPDQVRAVVMETTGDVSVLHAAPGGPELDPDLLLDVRGSERRARHRDVKAGA